MIHININDKKPPEKWCRDAQKFTEQLNSLSTSKERKELIEKKRKLWGKLKPWLLQLSHDKCWYSEDKKGGSHLHVDHFRPKNRAKGLDGTEREGYWWLAFDWKNYRISCNIVNNYKGDYFPLKEGSPVATGPDDLCDEIIYFLDPTNPDDPPLLAFDESGLPKPSARKGTWEYERAKVTIERLHLDCYSLVDKRKEIWNHCIFLINQAQNLMKVQSESDYIKSNLKDIHKALKKIISEDAELSSTAKACLLSTGIDWVRNLVFESLNGGE